MGDTVVSRRKRQRRRTTRTPISATGFLETDGGIVKGLCADLSLGGAFFIGSNLSKGEKVRVRIDLPNIGRFEGDGEVLGKRRRGDVEGNIIRFANLTETNLQRICRFFASQVA